MHSAHLNNKINIMEKDLGNFPLCGGCSRKERREGLKDGEFYCAIVDGILPNGIVYSGTDATDCANKGWYNSSI